MVFGCVGDEFVTVLGMVCVCSELVMVWGCVGDGLGVVRNCVGDAVLGWCCYDYGMCCGTVLLGVCTCVGCWGCLWDVCGTVCRMCW